MIFFVLKYNTRNTVKNNSTMDPGDVQESLYFFGVVPYSFLKHLIM
jgi:hypothetical protein